MSALAAALNPYAAPVTNFVPEQNYSNLIREAAAFLLAANQASAPSYPEPPREQVNFNFDDLYPSFEPLRKRAKISEVQPSHAEESEGPKLRPPAEPVVDLVQFPDMKDVVAELGLGKQQQLPAKPPAGAPAAPKSSKSSTPAIATAAAPNPAAASASPTAKPEPSHLAAHVGLTSKTAASVTFAPPKPAPLKVASASSPAVSFSILNVVSGKQPAQKPTAIPPASTAMPKQPVSLKNVDARVAAAQAHHPLALERPIVSYVHKAYVGVNLRQKVADLFFAEYLKRFGEDQKRKAINAAIKFEMRAFKDFTTEGTYRVQASHRLQQLRNGTEKRTDSDED